MSMAVNRRYCGRDRSRSARLQCTRFNAAGRMFRDENLDMLSKVLDTWFRVPGTNIRFGLDGIIGFIPGDRRPGGRLASCVIVLAAYFRGRAAGDDPAHGDEPRGSRSCVGAVPVLGNLFDIGWRANRQELRTCWNGR